MRNFSGDAVNKEVFQRFFPVNATPDWWAFLTTNKDRGYPLVNLSAGLDDVKEEQVMVNYELISGVVGWKATCLPRGGKFFLTVLVSPKVSEAQGSVSKDGNTYEVVLPTLVSVTSGQLEKIFKKGVK